MQELEADPDRTALRILELRAYAQTKAQIDAAKEAKDVPTGTLADLVKEIEVDVFHGRKRRHGR